MNSQSHTDYGMTLATGQPYRPSWSRADYLHLSNDRLCYTALVAAFAQFEDVIPERQKLRREYLSVLRIAGKISLPVYAFLGALTFCDQEEFQALSKDPDYSKWHAAWDRLGAEDCTPEANAYHEALDAQVLCEGWQLRMMGRNIFLHSHWFRLERGSIYDDAANEARMISLVTEGLAELRTHIEREAAAMTKALEGVA